jgi:hypothetical protein
MGNFISDLKDSWSSNTQGVAGVLLTIVTGALAAAGLVLLWYDLTASYYGWGKLVETEMNLPGSDLLALVVTAIPTLVQIAWCMAKVADHGLGNHTGVSALFWIMLIVDTALDLNQVVTGTTQSWIMSLIVVVLGFGLASEFMITFMGSTFIGMLKSYISSPSLWNPSAPQGSRGRASQGRPSARGNSAQGRPPTQGRRPPAGRRRDTRAPASRPFDGVRSVFEREGPRE